MDGLFHSRIRICNIIEKNKINWGRKAKFKKLY